MNSNAFKQFKNRMGQANHLLITILIGLDAVDDGATKRPDFNTTWNPKNVHFSVSRSRIYAINSALAWAVDNIDMYFRLCNKTPKLFTDEESREMDKTGHSVYKKYEIIVKNHIQISAVAKAFLDLLICWRNKKVHFDADNELSSNSLNFFKNIPSDENVVSKYHLDVSNMLDNFNKNQTPTFKEITTMISMAIHFIYEIDSILLKEVNQEEYLTTLLRRKFKENPQQINQLFNYYSPTAEKTEKKLRQFLIMYGLQSDFYNEDGNSFIKEISNKPFKEIVKKLI